MMADLPISLLPYVGNTGYTDNDLFVIVNYQLPSGTTSNTKILQHKEWVLSGLSSSYLPLSGGTVTGGTIFQSGLTANTISATTYFNLPLKYYAEPSIPPVQSPLVTGSGSTALGSGAQALDKDMFVYGTNAGSGATDVFSSNFIGKGAGYSANNSWGSNFMGFEAGYSAIDSYASTSIGYQAGYSLSGSYESIFIGSLAGCFASSTNFSIFLGTDSGFGAIGASESNFIGLASGRNAINSVKSNFIGYAGANSSGSTNSNMIGYDAGRGSKDVDSSNFIGQSAGFGVSGSSYSNLIGYYAGRTYSAGTLNNIGSNNIIIGTNISLPNAVENSINIGGVLFGINTYSTTAGNPSLIPTSQGKIGIGIVTPLNRLHVEDTSDPLRLVGLQSGNTDIRILTSDSNGVIRFRNFSDFTTGATAALGNYLPLSGGTVTGGTIFTSGVTANTISQVDYIDFTLTANPAYQEGRVHWDSNSKTLQIDTDVNGVEIEVGHENVVRVVNKTNTTLLKGELVYINGAQGQRPTVTRADYSGDSTSARTLGFVAANINNNNNGYVITYGMLRDVNTLAYSAGTQLYLFTGGTWTNVRPIAPKHEVRVGVVVDQNATTGIIFVSVMNGYELQELHDVSATTLNNLDVLQWNSSADVWQPTSNPKFNSVSATTISGVTSTFGTISATTISGGTFYGDGFNITNLPITASNGLTKTGNNISLGGALTANTTTITDGVVLNSDSFIDNRLLLDGSVSGSYFPFQTFTNIRKGMYGDTGTTTIFRARIETLRTDLLIQLSTGRTYNIIPAGTPPFSGNPYQWDSSHSSINPILGLGSSSSSGSITYNSGTDISRTNYVSLGKFDTWPDTQNDSSNVVKTHNGWYGIYGGYVDIWGGSGSTLQRFNYYSAGGIKWNTNTIVSEMVGYYVAPMTTLFTGITNSWGFYQEGTGEKNYFAGNTGIGIVTPTNKLHVTDTSDPLRLGGLQTLNTDTEVLTTDINGVIHKRPYDFVTGFTYASSSSTFTIRTSSGNTFNANINAMTGLTVNGNLTVTGNYVVSGDTIISGNTIFSGTTTLQSVNNGIGDFLTIPSGGTVTKRTSDQVRDDIGYYGLTFAITNGYY